MNEIAAVFILVNAYGVGMARGDLFLSHRAVSQHETEEACKAAARTFVTERAQAGGGRAALAFCVPGFALDLRKPPEPKPGKPAPEAIQWHRDGGKSCYGTATFCGVSAK